MLAASNKFRSGAIFRLDGNLSARAVFERLDYLTPGRGSLTLHQGARQNEPLRIARDARVAPPEIGLCDTDRQSVSLLPGLRYRDRLVRRQRRIQGVDMNGARGVRRRLDRPIMTHHRDAQRG
jgi:hypothetical protein